MCRTLTRENAPQVSAKEHASWRRLNHYCKQEIGFFFYYLKNPTKKNCFNPRFLLSSHQFLLPWNHSLATEYEGKKLLQKHYCYNLEVTLKQFITSQSRELCAPHLNYAKQPMPTAANKKQTRSVFLLKNRLQG